MRHINRIQTRCQSRINVRLRRIPNHPRYADDQTPGPPPNADSSRGSFPSQSRCGRKYLRNPDRSTLISCSSRSPLVKIVNVCRSAKCATVSSTPSINSIGLSRIAWANSSTFFQIRLAHLSLRQIAANIPANSGQNSLTRTHESLRSSSQSHPAPRAPAPESAPNGPDTHRTGRNASSK